MRILLLLPFLVPVPMHAQSIETTIQQIDQLCAGSMRWRAPSDQCIVLDSYHEGRRTGQDTLWLHRLDPMSFTADLVQRTIDITCHADIPRCITRENFGASSLVRSSAMRIKIPTSVLDTELFVQLVASLFANEPDERISQNGTDNDVQRTK